MVFAFYFFTNILNVFIQISFDFLNKQEKVKLKEINFFKTKKNVVAFIKREKLKLLEDMDIFSKTNIKNLIVLIKKYLSGEIINFYIKLSELNIEIDLQEKFSTKFSQDVIKKITDLKYGETTTYSNIGNEIGSKAYRAIGNVCKSNPIPLIIPCHRVIRKNGEIGGFMGKSDKNWETNLKKQLLKIEGYKI
ncbi:MAG: methylated-DNA--[protein]-cysteine S-methyltransferase [Promethearchaeota archaeon]